MIEKNSYQINSKKSSNTVNINIKVLGLSLAQFPRSKF